MSHISNFRRTADWLAACGKTQCEKDLSVQIGCHMEEFIEFIQTLVVDGPPDTPVDAPSPQVANAALSVLIRLAGAIKSGVLVASIQQEMREQALDALCDSEVTGNGIAYLAGFDKEAADVLVLRSNEAKLVDGKPVIKDGGKIGKPEGWVAPRLAACV